MPKCITLFLSQDSFKYQKVYSTGYEDIVKTAVKPWKKILLKD